MQSASHESTLTYQLYYAILLGVNFDIQTLLCNFKGCEWIVGFLQDVQVFGQGCYTQHIDAQKESRAQITLSCNFRYLII